MLAWLPEAEGLVANPEKLGEEKALLYLWPAWAERVSQGFPLRAILVPHPTGDTQTTARPLTPEAAYKAIVPDMLFTALGDARRAAAVMSRLIRTLPCYELALGSDLATVPVAIEAVLARHSP